MNDAVKSTPSPAVSAEGDRDMALAQAMADLQQAGADRFDPVQWHYLQALRARMPHQDGRVQALLQSRLDAALAALRARMAHTAVPAPAAQRPAKADTVAQAPALRTPLAALTQYLVQHAQALESQAGMGVDAHNAMASLPLRPELKAVRQFRNTWSKLSADQQLNRALDQAPKNAGPINSHMLVLRSLALMRDISPDYLNRFMSYADALLCLDRPLQEPAPSAKAAAKKARTPRSKAQTARPQ